MSSIFFGYLVGSEFATFTLEVIFAILERGLTGGPILTLLLMSVNRERKLRVNTEPALLIVDELGYLALDQQTSNLFYQVISTRHSHKRSTIITTNTAFSDWGNILHNTTIATAIADRLVENSEIFLLGGESVRKSKTTASPAN